MSARLQKSREHSTQHIFRTAYYLAFADMPELVAEGLTSLKNQMQASGAERRKLVPRMHQKSPFRDPNSKKNFLVGASSLAFPFF